jgi:hypothetical protein
LSKSPKELLELSLRDILVKVCSKLKVGGVNKVRIDEQ